MNRKICVVTLLLLTTHSAMADALPCQQTIVELPQAGGTASILFPPCAKVMLTANQVEEEEQPANAMLATGNVALTLTGGGILPLTIVAHQARISRRSVDAAQLRVIQQLQDSVQRDQHYRGQGALRAAMPDEAASAQTQLNQDNPQLLQRLVKQYGWPGIKTFGVEAANAAFLILQHADLATQQQYLPRFRLAVARQDAWPAQLAMLEDRMNVMQGRPQRYGSQLETHAEGEPRPCPLQDPQQVDLWRAGVGLPPLADYLQHFVATPPPRP